MASPFDAGRTGVPERPTSAVDEANLAHLGRGIGVQEFGDGLFGRPARLEEIEGLDDEAGTGLGLARRGSDATAGSGDERANGKKPGLDSDARLSLVGVAGNNGKGTGVIGHGSLLG
jgi:hypothetical protein